jgi:hypothetical protein
LKFAGKPILRRLDEGLVDAHRPVPFEQDQSFIRKRAHGGQNDTVRGLIKLARMCF